MMCSCCYSQFELDFTFKNIEISYLLFSFLYSNFILIFYIFLDNITLCIKCDIIKFVTPCLYHTGETDGVTLSRLGCTSQTYTHSFHLYIYNELL